MQRYTDNLYLLESNTLTNVLCVTIFDKNIGKNSKFSKIVKSSLLSYDYNKDIKKDENNNYVIILEFAHKNQCANAKYDLATGFESIGVYCNFQYSTIAMITSSF
jgi:hypothetical protein